MEGEGQHSWASASGVYNDCINVLLKSKSKWNFIQKVGTMVRRNPAYAVIKHN